MEWLAGGPLDGPHGTLAQSLRQAALDGRMGGYAVRNGDRLDRMPWTEVLARAQGIADALQAAGIGRGDRVAILGDTSREWKLADHAVHLLGAVVVPIYPTMPTDLVAHILHDSGAKAVFVQDAAQQDKLPDPGLPTWSLEPMDEVPCIQDLPQAAPRTDGLPDLDDPALLIYTSGTTGIPKGVLLSHRNLEGDVCSAIQCLSLDQVQDPSLVAFLPLAHIAGYVSLSVMVDLGATVLFSRPEHMATDMQWFHPTIALAVPRLWERIVRKVEETVDAGSPVRRWIFRHAKAVALEAGRAMEDGKALHGRLARRHRFYERLVYSKLRARLGFDRLKAAITGAAAVRADLLWFLQGIGLPVVEGYGMTEASALVTATRFDDWRGGTVGRPLPGHKIALDADGEILIGGIGVFQEYWNLPEETAATRVLVNGEPWVRTGDIGRLDPDGSLRIVDRKKELEVLDTGKMIAPVRVEELLKAETKLVEDSCLIGTGRKFAGMLIQPAYDALLHWAEAAGIRPDPSKVVRRRAPTGEEQTYSIEDEAFLAHPTVRGVFEQALAQLNDRLADYERVRTFHLVPHAFTIERDELTPSFKKRRRDIISHYRDKVEALFGGHSNDATV